MSKEEIREMKFWASWDTQTLEERMFRAGVKIEDIERDLYIYANEGFEYKFRSRDPHTFYFDERDGEYVLSTDFRTHEDATEAEQVAEAKRQYRAYLKREAKSL